MASKRVEREGARMRATNTETARRRLWRELQRRVTLGMITQSQAAAMRQRFWDDRAQDQRIAKGRE